MPEYLTPGVFIEEIERGPKTIEGVPTSIVAFLGETARGPVKPAIVTDYGSYLRCFGNVFAAGKYMPNAVKAFFANGGHRCYIARIMAATAAISHVLWRPTIRPPPRHLARLPFLQWALVRQVIEFGCGWKTVRPS